MSGTGYLLGCFIAQEDPYVFCCLYIYIYIESYIYIYIFRNIPVAKELMFWTFQQLSVSLNLRHKQLVSKKDH